MEDIPGIEGFGVFECKNKMLTLGSVSEEKKKGLTEVGSEI